MGVVNLAAQSRVRKLSELATGVVSDEVFWKGRKSDGSKVDYVSAVVLASCLCEHKFVHFNKSSKGFVERVGHQYVQSFGIKGSLRLRGGTASGLPGEWWLWGNFKCASGAGTRRGVVVEGIKELAVAQRLLEFYNGLIDGTIVVGDQS